MYLKDLLNDKQEEKDVVVLLDKGVCNLLSHITQATLFHLLLFNTYELSGEDEDEDEN